MLTAAVAVAVGTNGKTGVHDAETGQELFQEPVTVFTSALLRLSTVLRQFAEHALALNIVNALVALHCVCSAWHITDISMHKTIKIT